MCMYVCICMCVYVCVWICVCVGMYACVMLSSINFVCHTDEASIGSAEREQTNPNQSQEFTACTM